MVTPNVDHLVRLEHQPALKSAYGTAEFIYADGMPLVWASRLLRNALPERVTGADLFVRLCRQAVAQNWKMAVLGGKPGSEPGLHALFEQCYPGINVRILCPSMRFEPEGSEGEAAAAELRGWSPDIVFVCLGMPKQEKWALRFAPTFGRGLFLCVGAALEFGLGLQLRAPGWVQRAGFEWLWRLGSDPRRFWRRYLVDDPRFVVMCWREWRNQRAGG